MDKMTNLFRTTAVSWLLAAALATAAPAFAQVTDAQRSAIRSSCRADYQAHCSSVTPGGAEALQCLEKNMASLSSGCQSAVRAVSPQAAPKAESAPAAPKTEAAPAAPKADTAAAPPTPAPAAAAPAAAPKTASAPAKQPSEAQTAAIRSACRSDYPKVCAGVPTGGAPALQCLEKNKARLSSGCQQAVAAVGGGAAGGAAATAAAPAAASAAAPATPLVLRPMLPREELFVMRSACGADARSLCGGVAPGGGRIMQCLANQAASLSSECKGVLARFAAQ
jgi:hypothetical protein